MNRIIQFAICVVGCLGMNTVVTGQIFRWDNNEPIPPTESITPGPDIYRRWELDHADLANRDLSDTYFGSADLSFADLSNSNLSNAYLNGATLSNANLTSAIVSGASLGRTTSMGLTKEQIYSTQSYQDKNLRGVILEDNNLQGWDFSGQDLTGASFHGCQNSLTPCIGSNITDADFSDAIINDVNLQATGITIAQLYSTGSYKNKDLRGVTLRENNLRAADFSGQDLTDASFYGCLSLFSQCLPGDITDANFSSAIVSGVNFRGTGVTQEQIYSTQSYLEMNLPGIVLSDNDLSGFSFSGHILTAAHFVDSNLSQVNFENANLNSANLSGATFENGVIRGAVIVGAQLPKTGAASFTEDHLYSTASYQEKNLRGISITDVGRWNFNGQDLRNARISGNAGADFSSADLTNASFLGASLAGADLTDAIINHAVMGTTQLGFSRNQLYSTKSYQENDLTGIQLNSNNLSGWNFSQQDLRNAVITWSGLSNADFSGADLRNVDFTSSSIQAAIFDENTRYNQWTIFPDGFSPAERGMNFQPTDIGDFDASDDLGQNDVNLLVQMINFSRLTSRKARFDVTNDGSVDSNDLAFWVKDIKRTWFGDSNLDGVFDSSDLVGVFQTNQYEDRIEKNSTWATGDWDGDLEFSTSDLVLAFQDGGFEAGPRNAIATVPEPDSKTLMCFATMLLVFIRHYFATKITKKHEK